MPKTPDGWKPDESRDIKDIVLESHCGLGWMISMTVQDGCGVIDHSNFMDAMLGSDSDDDEDLLEGQMEALERLILAHACAGVDVEKDAYIEGIDSAFEAIANE